MEYIIIIIIALAVSSLIMSYRIVPEGYVYTVTRFGKYSGLLSPGLSNIIPWIEWVSTKVDMREQVMVMPPHTTLTADGVPVTIDVIIIYRIDNAALISYSYSNQVSSMQSMVLSRLNQLLRHNKTHEVLPIINDLSLVLKSLIHLEYKKHGVTILDVDIRQIVFPEVIRNRLIARCLADAQFVSRTPAITKTIPDIQEYDNKPRGTPMIAKISPENAPAMDGDTVMKHLADEQPPVTQQVISITENARLHAVNSTSKDDTNAVDHSSASGDMRMSHAVLDAIAVPSDGNTQSCIPASRERAFLNHGA